LATPPLDATQPLVIELPDFRHAAELLFSFAFADYGFLSPITLMIATPRH